MSTVWRKSHARDELRDSSRLIWCKPSCRHGFLQRGFDAVTVDEIAEAADVGRMTVFNHFPRKEDLFYDRDEEFRHDVRETLRSRDRGTTPIEALRLLAHRVIAEQKPYCRFVPESRHFFETVEASETLKARARAIRDELAQFLATALADDPDECVGSETHLVSHMVVTVWAIAFVQAHRDYRQRRNAEEARTIFLALVDRGMMAVEAATVDNTSTR